ncbi:hypothetical protein JCM3765_006479 [Sporobolomyces pararoseus]
MPIPSLALDVVFEIVFHLEEEEDDKIADQIQDGKTISLVCRAWRSLGQGLLWRTVIIDASTLPSLSDHFGQFPHLAKLVRSFKYTSDSSRDTDTVHLARIRRSLSTLINLHELSLESKFEENLVPILRAASLLENLVAVTLIELGHFNCSNEFVSSFQTGFKKLSTLGFIAANSPHSSLQLDTRTDGSAKLPLEKLCLVWWIEPVDASRFANDLLSIFNPAALKSVVLAYRAVFPALVGSLSNFPNVVNVSFHLHPKDDLGDLAQILRILSRFSSLEKVKIQLTDVDAEDGFESPVSLNEIIACFSPSLQVFLAEQFILPDVFELPVRKKERPNDSLVAKLISVRCPSDESEGGSTKMMLWGEEEEGKVRWFRSASELKEEK